MTTKRRAHRSANLMYVDYTRSFGVPRRDDEFDDGFVKGLMVRVCQDDLDLVRSCGKTDEDEGLAAGISPVPRRIIHDDVDVPDAGRNIEGIWAEHRYDPEILGTILDKDHAVGEWFGQGRIDNDLRRGLRGRERYDAGRPEHVARGLSHGGGRVESSSPCYQGHESWLHR